MTLRRRGTGPELAVTGEVEHERIWSWDELDGLPGTIPDLGAEADGFVGIAVPLAPVLDASMPTAAATHATIESDDGHYRASIPLSDLMQSGWLAYGLDGRPLPGDRGGPLRVVVPQGRTLCWNVKSVAVVRVTAGPEPDSVPENPPH